MESTRLNGRNLLVLASVAVILAGATAQADTVVGQFSNPVVIGYVANYPTPGTNTLFDNSAGAVFSIENSPIGTNDILRWGANPSQSTLGFFGATIPADPTVPFTLGSLFYFNGTSDLNTLIFGATLTFYKSSNLSDPIGTDSIIITTTSNQFSGTGLTLDQLNADADYINVCGSASIICDKSIQAYEAGENGASGFIGVDLAGTIIGDPVLTVQNVTLQAGSVGNGIIGDQPQQGQVPEPSSLVLMSSVLVFGAGLARRARRRIQS